MIALTPKKAKKKYLHPPPLIDEECFYATVDEQANTTYDSVSRLPDELPKSKVLGLLASQANTCTMYLATLVQRYRPLQASSLSVPERRFAYYIPKLKHLGVLARFL